LKGVNLDVSGYNGHKEGLYCEEGRSGTCTHLQLSHSILFFSRLTSVKRGDSQASIRAEPAPSLREEPSGPRLVKERSTGSIPEKN
jgi:hypothetical protein